MTDFTTLKAGTEDTSAPCNMSLGVYYQRALASRGKRGPHKSANALAYVFDTQCMKVLQVVDRIDMLHDHSHYTLQGYTWEVVWLVAAVTACDVCGVRLSTLTLPQTLPNAPVHCTQDV